MQHQQMAMLKHVNPLKRLARPTNEGGLKSRRRTLVRLLLMQGVAQAFQIVSHPLVTPKHCLGPALDASEPLQIAAGDGLEDAVAQARKVGETVLGVGQISLEVGSVADGKGEVEKLFEPDFRGKISAPSTQQTRETALLLGIDAGSELRP